MSSVEYVERLYLSNNDNIIDIKWPQKVDYIYFPTLVTYLSDIEFPNDLKGLFFSSLTKIYDIKLPDNLEQLGLRNLEFYDKLQLPSNLKILFISSLDVIKDFTIYDDLEVYIDDKLVNKESLNNYCNVKKKREKTCAKLI